MELGVQSSGPRRHASFAIMDPDNDTIANGRPMGRLARKADLKLWSRADIHSESIHDDGTLAARARALVRRTCSTAFTIKDLAGCSRQNAPVRSFPASKRDRTVSSRLPFPLHDRACALLLPRCVGVRKRTSLHTAARPLRSAPPNTGRPHHRQLARTLAIEWTSMTPRSSR